MKESYIYGLYTVFPKEGKIVRTKTGAEVGSGKKLVAIYIEGGKRKVRAKLRVIYEAVHGPLKAGTIIRPINGDDTDARYDNICVIPRKEYFDGHDWSMKFAVSEEDVKKIRDDYKTGNYSYVDLAIQYRCSLSTIQKIIKRTYCYDKKA